MAAKKKSSAFDFITERLRKNRKAEYQEIATAAKKKGFTIYPIQYGRAQALLGIVKTARKKKAGKRRGPGRPPKSGARRRAPAGHRGAVDTLETLIGGIKNVQRDRDQLRGTLEKIRDLIERAL